MENVVSEMEQKGWRAGWKKTTFVYGMICILKSSPSLLFLYVVRAFADVIISIEKLGKQYIGIGGIASIET